MNIDQTTDNRVKCDKLKTEDDKNEMCSRRCLETDWEAEPKCLAFLWWQHLPNSNWYLSGTLLTHFDIWDVPICVFRAWVFGLFLGFFER